MRNEVLVALTASHQLWETSRDGARVASQPEVTPPVWKIAHDKRASCQFLISWRDDDDLNKVKEIKQKKAEGAEKAPPA